MAFSSDYFWPGKTTPGKTTPRQNNARQNNARQNGARQNNARQNDAHPVSWCLHLCSMSVFIRVIRTVVGSKVSFVGLCHCSWRGLDVRAIGLFAAQPGENVAGATWKEGASPPCGPRQPFGFKPVLKGVRKR